MNLFNIGRVNLPFPKVKGKVKKKGIKCNVLIISTTSFKGYASIQIFAHTVSSQKIGCVS